MAGFASAIGGAGQAAEEYGKQIRGLLEQRRTHFADLLSKAADQESDPQRRSELLGHVADLHGGVDISKVAPKVIKTVQTHAQSDHALAQLFGGPPEQPKPKPGPAQPGMTPGIPSVTNMQGAAAQPATSPVAPQAQTAPQPQISPITNFSPVNPPQPAAPDISPVQAQASAPQPSAPPAQPSGLPDLAIQDPMVVMQKYMGHPMWGAPANRPALQAAMTQELSHNEALRQTVEQSQAALQIGLQKLGMINDPRVVAAGAKLKSQGVPEFLIPTMIGSALGIQMPAMTSMMSASFGQPIKSQIDATGMSPQDKVDMGLSQDATGKWTVEHNRMNRNVVERAYQGWAGSGVVTDETGGQQRVSNNQQLGPNAIRGVAAPVVAANVGRHQVTGSSGNLEFRTAGEINRGNFQNPQFAPVSTQSSSIPTIEGGTINTKTVQRQTGGGSSTPQPISKPQAQPGATPVPQGQVRPFDPSNPMDHLVGQIAQDAANEKLISTRGPFSAQNPSKAMVNQRMAQLGIDPNNVSGSIRDRAKTAQTLIPHLNEVDNIINQAEKDGDLGILASRWNDFLTNKLGKDPTKSQVFSKLSSNLSFLTTAAAMVHGGVRAGGSKPMVEHWQEVLSAADPATLRSKLAVARNWVNGYSQMAGSSAPILAPLPGSVKKYNPATGKIE